MLDDGYFGKGIYFTSNLDYGITYYGKPNNNGEYIVLVTFIILGNVYPVIEYPDLKGKPCQVNN